MGVFPTFACFLKVRRRMPTISVGSGSVSGATLTYLKDGREETLSVGSGSWYAWLETATSFTFKSEAGSFTAHKTRAGNGRGSWYWRAYRRQHGHLFSVYLGSSANLTLERLHEAARHLSSLANAGMASQETRLSAPEQTSSPEVSVDPLLATKLHMPRLPMQHITRPHLIALLNQSVQQQALILVSAPAGSGKTTLLAEWASAAPMPLAWLSLEPADNAPKRFLSYLIAALARLDARIGRGSLSLLHGARSRSLERELVSLVNDLATYLQEDSALILDDYHLITEDAVHEMLLFLLDHLPPCLHLVIGTRADPPLPLARLRARGQLSELRVEELRFASAEVSAFVRAMGLELSGDALLTLEQRTEGWIAGVQLVALALRGRADPAAVLRSFPGSHRFLLEYVSEEILAQQPSEVRTFLLRTSLLEQLCGSLCEAVTGLPDGRAMLEGLRRANLFVSVLDEAGEWYRYHALFAEVLRAQLQQREPHLIPELYRRASAWYEQRQQFIEACDYALLARDYSHAAELIESQAYRLLGRGEFNRLIRWLASLPPEALAGSPRLHIASAWMFLFDNQIERAEEMITHIEQQIREERQTTTDPEWIEVGSLLAMFSAILALRRNDHKRAIELVQQTLHLLSSEAPELHRLLGPHLGIILGMAYRASGDLASAEQVLLEANDIHPSDYSFFDLVALHDLGELYQAQGQLRKLGHLYERLLQKLAQHTEQPPFPYAMAYASYANLLVEWNRLDEAAPYIQRALVLGRPTGMESIFLIFLAMQADVAQGPVSLPEALDLLQRVEAEAARGDIPIPLMQMLPTIRALILLASGQVEEALRWEQKRGLHPDDAFKEPLENDVYFEYSTLARVLSAHGRAYPTGPSLAQAMTLLERLHRSAEQSGFTGWVIETLALKAVVLQAQGQTQQALAALGQSLALAEPEGYVRLFVSQGESMARLLARVSAYTTASPAYIQKLLAAMKPGQQAAAWPKPSSQLQPLIDQLSHREQEVLRLLAAGASNQEIATRLVITLNTAKRHVKHILAKLAATNRTQAVARARELHLL